MKFLLLLLAIGFALPHYGEMDAQTKELLKNREPYVLNDAFIAEYRKSDESTKGLVNVKEVKNVSIEGPVGPIALRIYSPPVQAPVPILVFLHGGGWVFGTLDDYDLMCREFCVHGGCIVVSVDYHRAPEHTYPIPLEDCYFATKWVTEHAASLGGTNKIAIGGDSAGGNLAASVTLLARERKEFELIYQLLINPVTNCNLETLSYYQFGEGYSLTRSSMRFMWEKYLGNLDRGKEVLASPLKAESLSHLPPACVVIADYDPLRDEGLAYAWRLQEAGVRTVVKRIPSIHGFYLEPLDIAKEAISFMATQLSENLR